MLCIFSMFIGKAMNFLVFHKYLELNICIYSIESILSIRDLRIEKNYALDAVRKNPLSISLKCSICLHTHDNDKILYIF